MASKPSPDKSGHKPDKVLRASHGGQTHLLGSFPADADDIHIDAAKHRFINRLHAEGRDANDVAFSLTTSDEE